MRMRASSPKLRPTWWDGAVAALVAALAVLSAVWYYGGLESSGPLTATFMLPFAMGATTALGGNVMTDAFGLVAMVAMMPLITVQVMGAIYVVKSSRVKTQEAAPVFADEGVIELWEVA